VANKSVLASADLAFAISLFPITIPGGKPVTDDPGLSPKFPFINDGPVLVIAELANISKFSNVPILIIL
jgi:hypothetical protein